MKFVVGLTGLCCAGKSEAAKVFVEEGFVEIDVDALGHEALEQAKSTVVERFGSRVLSPDGKVDRKKLGAQVFKDRKQLMALEQILHPLMVQRVKEWVSEAEGPFVLNAALLYKMGLDSLCQRVVIIKAPLLDRINRCMDRDGLNVWSTLRRIQAQRKLIPQPSYQRADTIIVENRGSRVELREKIQNLIRQWTNETGLVWNKTRHS